jgi:hypothetical protein
VTIGQSLWRFRHGTHAVAAEDPLRGGKEMLANCWRGQDLDPPAEAREAVGGGLLVLKGEGHLLPAMLVGGKGGAHGFPGRVAEYLGECGESLCRCPDPDRQSRPAGLELL